MRYSTVVDQLVLNGEHKKAIQLLEKSKINQQYTYLLSLLYRITFGYDEYLKEKKLLEIIPFTSEYFEKRKQWHALPMFEKLEPREKVNLPRDINKIPNKETLKNLCFLLSCDSKYIEFLIQCIESIQQTSYRDTPINIVDLGLTEADKEKLSNEYKVKEIKKPEIPILNQNNPAMLGVNIKAFLHDIFPSYKYIVCIDCDIWVQNEAGFDELLHLSEKQGIAVCENAFYMKPKDRKQIFPSNLPENIWNKIKEQRAISSGIFCINNQYKDFFKSWEKNFCDLHTHTEHRHNDEISLLETIVDFKIKELIPDWQHSSPYCGWYIDNDLIYYKKRQRLISFPHLSSSSKKSYFMPIEHKGKGKKEYPIQHRVLPYSEKPKIKEEILNFINSKQRDSS